MFIAGLRAADPALAYIVAAVVRISITIQVFT
jgi:hypothetical protein